MLFFTEPVDELVAHSLPEFEGRRFRSVATGQVELGDEAERERAEQDAKEQAERFGDLLTSLTGHLESRVRGVRVSRRLTSSLACLAGEEVDHSPRIERMLSGKPTASTHRRTLEVNANHPIMRRLRDRFAEDNADPLIGATAELLLGVALLAEGSQLPEPIEFTARVTDLLARTLELEA